MKIQYQSKSLPKNKVWLPWEKKSTLTPSCSSLATSNPHSHSSKLTTPSPPRSTSVSTSKTTSKPHPTHSQQRSIKPRKRTEPHDSPSKMPVAEVGEDGRWEWREREKKSDGLERGKQILGKKNLSKKYNWGNGVT